MISWGIEYHKEIKTLFNSGINLKILIYLYSRTAKINEICSGINSTYSPVLKKLKYLTDFGIISNKQGLYSLTTTGKILAFKTALIIEDYHKNIYPGAYDRIQKSMDYDENNIIFREVIHFEKSINDIQKIFRSEYNIKLLACLGDSITDREELKLKLGLSGSKGPALTKKIHWLKEKGIITGDIHHYYLKPGYEQKPVEIINLIKTIGAIIRHGNYFNSHIIEDLPRASMLSIGDLINSEQIYDTSNIPDKKENTSIDMISDADYIYSLSNCISPGNINRVKSNIKTGAFISTIITKDNSFRYYNEISENHPELLRYRSNIKILTGNIPETFAMTVTDKVFTIRFSAGADGAFDTSRALVSTSKEARDWGIKLYEHYQKDATPIEDYISSQNHRI